MGRSEAESHEILSKSSVIAEDVIWEKHGRPDYVRAKMKVSNPETRDLECIVNASLSVPGRCIYSLLLRGEPVKRLEINGAPHTNPDGRKFDWGATHKHAWKDVHKMGEAYSPADITGTDVFDVFVQFCAECNMEFKGKWQAIPQAPLIVD